MKTSLLSWLILLISFFSQAQSLKGKIVDSKTNQPLPFTTLTLTALTDSNQLYYASSDSIGVFNFTKLQVGSYSLSASLMGYQKLEKPIIVKGPLTLLDLGNLSMTEDLNLLQTVIITGGTANFATQNGQLKIGVANNTLFRSASNLLDVFKRLPGLQLNPDGTMLMGNRINPTLFVDGKPLNMNNDEIQTYLSSLSPNMVESIEMINQPSAKYDGQYQGIIDVKLKRNQLLGLRGTYNLRFQQNNNALLDNNLALSYKTTKLTYNLNLGNTTGSTYYRYHALQYLASSNAMTTNTTTITANQNYNLQARLGYEPTKGQHIEAFFRTYQIRRKANTTNQLLTQSHNLANTLAVLQSDNNNTPKQFNYATGINYDAQFKTGELHLLTTIAQIDNRQTEDILNINQVNKDVISHWNTNSRNNILIKSLQADYTQPINSDKLEFGGKYAYTTTANNLRYDTLGTNGFVVDPNRSNLFSYKEYIAAAYFSYLGTHERFNYSISLRTEHTRTLAHSITEAKLTERNDFKWLPSASLTYQLTSKQQLNLSYSKRLTRPTFEALNPFRFYYSPRNYWIGNPYLQPSTTHIFSLSYSIKALNIAINAGRERDPMVRYPEYNPVTNVLAYMGTNLPYRDFASIQASSPLTFNTWWRMNNNIAFYYNKELRPYFGQTFSIPIYNYTLNGSQVFTLKKWLLDVGYSYESKSGNGLYIFSPVTTFDLALQRFWMKNKINTKLGFQDIFDSGKRRVIFRDKTIIDNDFYHYNGTSKLVFSLTYNFGSATHNTKEARKSEEETRANR